MQYPRLPRRSDRFGFAHCPVITVSAAFFAFSVWLEMGLDEAWRQQVGVHALTKPEVGGEVKYEERFKNSGLPEWGDITPWWNSRRWLYALTGDRRFQAVVSVKLSNAGVISDSQWHYLRSFPAAREVDARGTNLSDKHLRYLRAMPNLKFLSLGGTRISGEGLRYLQSLRSLQTLSLEGVRLNDRGKQELGKLVNLRRLTMDRDDGTLAHLVSLYNLTDLTLPNTDITDGSMVHVGKIWWLQQLNLTGAAVSDEGLRHLEASIGSGA